MPDEPEQSVMAADQRHLSGGAPDAASVMARLPTAVYWCASVLILLQLIAGQALARESRAGAFDYYTLSLSWSPTYCDTEAGSNDRQQCGPGRRFAFVVHGLWPQYESGWPENCDASETWVPDDAIAKMLSIMPSRKLVIHEWRRHGSCSGLDIDDYFAMTRALFAMIKIPARYLSPNTDLVVTPKQITDDFIKTNRELTAGMMSVQCGNRSDQARLSELRVCFDREGTFRDCGSNERRQCRARSLVLPRVR
jgi:ribonuclease T2